MNSRTVTVREVLADLDGQLFADVPQVAIVLRTDVRTHPPVARQRRDTRNPHRPALARTDEMAARGRRPRNERGRSLGPARPKPRPPAERTGLDVPSIGTDPSRGTSPPADISNAAGQGGADVGQTVPCQREPASLAVALAELLELSDERDQWQQRLGDEFRAGFAIGHALGVDEGRRLEADERDRAWSRAAGVIIRGETYDELERRRWGPGGREHFGDPRPGDYPGQRKGAA